MIQDITGQPTAGPIGGVPDLMAQITAVSVNRSPADLANVQEGFTDPVQGPDYDQVQVSKAETLTPDTPVASFTHTVPLLAIAILGAVLYFAYRKK